MVLIIEVHGVVRSSSNVALRLVEAQPFQRREEEFWSRDEAGEFHSLHRLLSWPQSTRAELASYLVTKFSRKGEKILDPFAGGGSFALEAALQDRVVIASDINPLSIKTISAKLMPADLAEVTIRLQKVALKGPVDLGFYRDYFAPFFHIDTFCELLRLRAAIDLKYDRVGKFLEAITLGLLHGNSAGYLSAYTSNQIAPSPEEQHRLNQERGSGPEYRAVSPRIIRKTALCTRDGGLSTLEKNETAHSLTVRDARDLGHIASDSIGITLTSPPVPGENSSVNEHWLRLWFTGVERRDIEPRLAPTTEMSSWCGFMNESLLELARVTRHGGRAVLHLREAGDRFSAAETEDELLKVVDSSLGRYWNAECSILHAPTPAKVDASVMRDRHAEKDGKTYRVLVLRRR